MILLNDFKRQWADCGEAVLDAVRVVGASGWYVLGEEVLRFEEAIAATWGRRFCVGVGSGLDAIGIALRALGCGPGDRVVTSPNSAFATTLAIVKSGAVPIFADVDAGGQIDLAQCQEILETRRDVRFLVPVHLYGEPLDPEALAAIRARFDCRIVEDCAQSILARRGGRPAGVTGQATATSFYPTKNLGALGDGGAILTDDAELAEAARQLRDYGQSEKYRHTRLGTNSRLDELHAAILRRAFLPRLGEWTRRRREIAGRYRAGIRQPRICVPAAEAEGVGHLFPVLVPTGARAAFRLFLKERGVATGEHYPLSIPDQPTMRDVPFEAPFGLARVRDFCAREVSLPIHAYLLDEEVGRVVEAVNAWEG
jgi:dTDP-3-amino-3,4,6-trideoxy-alpha-D-glucose transaminase